ncbi:MAG: hypothetical protein KGM96_04940 [Acidobacteriota bacterium]|nr:hypothetical protein [Acidobacteriota bacterium]
MHAKSLVFVFAGLLSCLSLATPVARAQQPEACTKDMFTGTYAFHEKGSSSVFPESPQPAPPFWNGMLAPFVTVGEVTMKSNGVGEGFYWIRVGSINGGADPIPVETTITEFNADCTGKFSYSLTLPGHTEPTIVTERFILFQNGSEFRTIPTDIVNGVPYLTWIGEGHRLSGSSEPPHNCGPQTAAGSYLISGENLGHILSNVPLYSEVLLLRYDASNNGDYEGTLYEKLGPAGNIVLPASGTIKVNPDCSLETTLNITVLNNPVTINSRGVFFDQGKRFYALVVSSGGIQFSFIEGKRINAQPDATSESLDR